MLFCLILNWAALNDGVSHLSSFALHLLICQFQQQVPGNIIPMPAFVNQFADTVIDGQPAVSAKVVSFWQGFPEMSKTLGMFAGGPIADKYGRR